MTGQRCGLIWSAGWRPCRRKRPLRQQPRLPRRESERGVGFHQERRRRALLGPGVAGLDRRRRRSTPARARRRRHRSRRASSGRRSSGPRPARARTAGTAGRRAGRADAAGTPRPSPPSRWPRPGRSPRRGLSRCAAAVEERKCGMPSIAWKIPSGRALVGRSPSDRPRERPNSEITPSMSTISSGLASRPGRRVRNRTRSVL